MSKQKIFISHAKKDEIIVQKFIDTVLVGTLGFNLNSDIFCTSVDGAKIAASKNWRKEIRDALSSSKVSILIITSNYRESEVCMNEMGAIWACSEHIFPLIIEPVTFSDFSALLCEVQGELLTDERGLDRVKDQLIDIFDLTGIKSDNWTRQKTDLLSALRIELKNNPFLTPLSRETFEDSLKKIDELNMAYDSLSVEKQKSDLMYAQLSKLKDKADVDALEYEHSDKTEYDEFDNLVNTIKSAANGIDGVVLTLVYNDIAKQELNIDYRLYADELSQAKARGQINDEEIIISDNKRIKPLLSSLEALVRFLENSISPETSELIERDYPEIDINIKNLDFWEKVLRLRLRYK